jgi:hypothetical protein
MEDVGVVLVKFLVLSVVFETAMTPIFNWRFFLKHFEGKGVKTPLTVGLAFLVFWSYNLDIVRDILRIWDETINLSLGGQFITALLIAGGSDGFSDIYKLGIRNPRTARQSRALQNPMKQRISPVNDYLTYYQIFKIRLGAFSLSPDSYFPVSDKLAAWTIRIQTSRSRTSVRAIFLGRIINRIRLIFIAGLIMTEACSTDFECKIDRLFRDYQGDVPGAAVMAIRHGQPVLVKSYGLADYERHIPVTDSTNFRLASLTKQFTAMSIMILKEREMDYTQTLCQIFPEVPIMERITIRNLLQLHPD